MIVILLIVIVCSISDHMTCAKEEYRKDTCTVCVAESDYCDSNWLPYNNLNAGLRGIDLPKKVTSMFF